MRVAKHRVIRVLRSAAAKSAMQLRCGNSEYCGRAAVRSCRTRRALPQCEPGCSAELYSSRSVASSLLNCGEMPFATTRTL